jgi:hypothetical protein
MRNLNNQDYTDSTEEISMWEALFGAGDKIHHVWWCLDGKFRDEQNYEYDVHSFDKNKFLFIHRGWHLPGFGGGGSGKDSNETKEELEIKDTMMIFKIVKNDDKYVGEKRPIFISPDIDTIKNPFANEDDLRHSAILNGLYHTQDYNIIEDYENKEGSKFNYFKFYGLLSKISIEKITPSNDSVLFKSTDKFSEELIYAGILHDDAKKIKPTEDDDEEIASPPPPISLNMSKIEPTKEEIKKEIIEEKLDKIEQIEKSDLHPVDKLKEIDQVEKSDNTETKITETSNKDIINITVNLDLNKDLIEKSNTPFKIATKHKTINTNEIHRKNAVINSFLDKLCKSTFSQDKLKEILNEISDNFESYENQKFKLVTLKYRICNHISINEKISNLFFDLGYNLSSLSTNINNFKLNNILKDQSLLREIILFDEANDNNLRSMIDKTLYFEKHKHIYKDILKLVINYLGNETNDSNFNKFIQEYSINKRTNIVNIGDIYCAIDRHKSLLFKYLCDKVDLPCAVFRYVNINQNKIIDKHVWNLISIDKIIYVVDFKNFHGKIVKPSNKDTENYYKINEFIL